jgi:hypothetical protein
MRLEEQHMSGGGAMVDNEGLGSEVGIDHLIPSLRPKNEPPIVKPTLAELKDALTFDKPTLAGLEDELAFDDDQVRPA